MKITSYYCACS